MSAESLFQFLKPFLWMALAAFMTGFFSYLLVGGAHIGREEATEFVPLVSAPVSDDWNLPKRI